MKIIILGFGVEGRAAAGYFAKHHPTSEVTVIDRNLPSIDALGSAAYVAEDHGADAVAHAGLVLRSPGVPPTHPLVQAAMAADVPMTTPTGYWLSRHAPPTTITVTGTKGKSSTAQLLADILRALGNDAAALGNVGRPPLAEALPDVSTPVVELSSYMMHDLPPTTHFHVVTSLYREHIDWHGDEAAYAAAKLRPFRWKDAASGIAPRAVIEANGLAGVQAIEDVVPETGGTLTLGDVSVTPSELHPAFAHQGLLQALRTATAVAMTRHSADAVADAVRTVADQFTGLPSRQEEIPTSDGRLWINDALATVPEATLMAMDRFGDRPLTLLLGGADRGQDFNALASVLASRPAVTPIVFGSVRGRLMTACLNAHASIIVLPDFDSALEKARDITARDGIVLFSPAAASEAPHGNFERRAAAFRDVATRDD